LPHELIECDLWQWSFNLFCLSNEPSDKSSGEYSKQVVDMFPESERDAWGGFQNKLPNWGW